MYKLLTEDKHYVNTRVVETNTFQEVSLDIDIVGSKLFSNDIFDFENNKINIAHSHVRSCVDIPGILDLGITHGKHKGKFLYLCKPDDKRLPNFLVPYKQPYKFDKSVNKLYVTFCFDNWDNKQPLGSMRQNFGNIENINNFYEYILYCKSLNVSIQQFTRNAKSKMANKSSEEIVDNISKIYELECVSKSDEFIFTLDSQSSNDRDDALSYNFRERKATIYITNVALVMEYLDLWNSFTKRISTIYLPDKKRTMLPANINELLLSLDAKQNRICYALELFYDEQDNIVKQNIKVCKAYISRNYYYESPEKYENNKHYMRLLDIVNAENSKDLITKMMILFNRRIAEYLSVSSSGVYRDLTIIDDKTLNQRGAVSPPPIDALPPEIFQHIKRWRTNSSKYSLLNHIEDKSDLYMQATSPMRRLVDVLNNISILERLGMMRSDSTLAFYKHWTEDTQLEYINLSSRSIRKIQSKCQIYAQYMQNKENNVKMNYVGYLFDKIAKHDGKYQYMVYLPQVRLTTYVTLLDDLENYSKHLFNLYVFMNQEQDKNKIKLQLCVVE